MVRIVIAAVPTRLRMLIGKHGYYGAVVEHLKKTGESIAEYSYEDSDYTNAVGSIRHFVPQRTPVTYLQKYKFSTFVFGNDDVVIACGTAAYDGVVPYVKELPIVLVDPASDQPPDDPLVFASREVGGIVQKAKNGELKIQMVTEQGITVRRIVR